MNSNSAISSTSFARGKGQPDRDIYNLLATLNQELVREKHDIGGLYEGRLRSHARGFEELKRKWEGFMGVPVPKKLRTALEPIEHELVANAKAVNFVKNIRSNVIDEGIEEEEEEEEQQPVIIPSKNPILTTMPPHPDDRIDVDNMVVNDLRKELKKRQLATVGRKAELQERLRDYLVKANAQREMDWVSKYATDIIKENTIVQKKQVQISVENHDGCNDNANKMDVVIEGDKKSSGNNMAADESEDIEFASVVKEKVTNYDAGNPMEENVQLLEQVAQPSSVHSTMAKKQAPKSALKPSKHPSSFIENSSQLADMKPAPESMPRSFLRVESPCPKQLLSNTMFNTSTESSTSTSAFPNTTFNKSFQSSALKSNASYLKVHTTPGKTSFRTGGAEPATILQKTVLEEMRQRSQPITTGATSTTKAAPSHSKYAIVSSLKKIAPSSSSSEIKKNPIQAEIREKMAAQKTSARANLIIPSQTAEPTYSMSSAFQTQMTASSQYVPKPHPTALTNVMDPANKPVSSPKKVPDKQLSPKQTYEMSDREESDSDCESDEEDEQRPKKAIPLWAQKANLHRALERQFADGPDRLDPDKIFGEVLTCNLEEIFDKKKSRYQRRTSSGNWTKDHVTLAEKLTYKRTMGYDKKL